MAKDKKFVDQKSLVVLELTTEQLADYLDPGKIHTVTMIKGHVRSIQVGHTKADLRANPAFVASLTVLCQAFGFDIKNVIDSFLSE